MTEERDAYSEKAFELVREGGNLFITGKAGTGKTYLLRKIVADAKDRGLTPIVVSPTGVAAKNAGGVTIHSFLKLPTSYYVPKMKVDGMYALGYEEIEIVKRTDMIIIDEISMVRCDLLDMMDDVLRHYRKSELPFGGIQMIFIGDLFQLMPVAKEEDWTVLKRHYKTPYFFSSKVFESMDCPMFELKKVHRQSNSDFIKLLNSVRSGNVSSSDLNMLQRRFQKNPKIDEQTIRLTTHNNKAWVYNQDRLKAIKSSTKLYSAWTEGYFPLEEFPTDSTLRLKRGARVMFIRNDNEFNLYCNGTLGTIIDLNSNEVTVKTDEGRYITVGKQKWEKQRYHINKESKKIETIVCGSFTQLPLKLAWAITIHKSQGLTFEKVVIDAGRAFTYGQVYVALSRCKTFAGITLVSPITEKIIKTDPVVVDFMVRTPQILIEEDLKPHVKDTVNNGALRSTRMLVKEGLSIEEIIDASGEDARIVYSHLAKLIEQGEADIHQFITKPIYNAIIKALKKVGTNATLKEIKEYSGNKVAYAEIRLVLADIKRQGTEDRYGIKSDNDLVDKTPVEKKQEVKSEEKKVVVKKSEERNFHDQLSDKVPNATSSDAINYLRAMAAQKKSLQEMVKHTGWTEEEIRHHLVELIRSKEVNIQDYIRLHNYNLIIKGIQIVGSNESLETITKYCSPKVTCGEICMVLADLKSKGTTITGTKQKAKKEKKKDEQNKDVADQDFTIEEKAVLVHSRVFTDVDGMIKKKKSIKEIMEESGQDTDFIYGRIKKYYLKGWTYPFDFLTKQEYGLISRAIKALGTDASLNNLKERCPSFITKGMIDLVLTYLKTKDIRYATKKRREELNKGEGIDRVYRNIKYSLESHSVTSCNCSFVLSKDGYYLKNVNEYFHVGDYPDNVDMNIGEIKIIATKDIKKEYEVYHLYNGIRNLIGYIKEHRDFVKFKNPDGESLVFKR